MAKTPSTMLDLGTLAPTFSLPDTQGNLVSLKDFSNQPLLVVFACNHCPYVLHILTKFSNLMRDYQARGLAVVMINANDVINFPADSPEKMQQLSTQYEFTFPYIFDETQQVAKAYKAACTPDFFLFDDAHQLYYRGQFDDSRPGNTEPVDGHDLVDAIEKLLAKQHAPSKQVPSLGCNIKWKAGNEPDYFG
jgi:peroxiredoxin